jgi:hypothetical protein
MASQTSFSVQVRYHQWWKARTADTVVGEAGMRKSSFAGMAVVAVLVVAACRTGQPIYDQTPEDQTTPGTIAGILRAGEGGEPIAGRQVHAVALSGGRRYSVTTSVTGGFSIPVPPGKYRLEVDLRDDERILRSPGTIDINESDLDANLDLVIGG